jgi:hypothetical protein
VITGLRLTFSLHAQHLVLLTFRTQRISNTKVPSQLSHRLLSNSAIRLQAALLASFPSRTRTTRLSTRNSRSPRVHGNEHDHRRSQMPCRASDTFHPDDHARPSAGSLAARRPESEIEVEMAWLIVLLDGWQAELRRGGMQGPL